MAGVKQPEGPQIRERAAAFPDVAPRPATGAGPSQQEAADMARLAGLLRRAHRDGEAEGDARPARDDGGSRDDGEHGGEQSAGDPDDATVPARAARPPYGGSRADGLLAFLDGARRREAAPGAVPSAGQAWQVQTLEDRSRSARDNGGGLEGSGAVARPATPTPEMPDAAMPGRPAMVAPGQTADAGCGSVDQRDPHSSDDRVRDGDGRGGQDGEQVPGDPGATAAATNAPLPHGVERTGQSPNLVGGGAADGPKSGDDATTQVAADEARRDTAMRARRQDGRDAPNDRDGGRDGEQAPGDAGAAAATASLAHGASHADRPSVSASGGAGGLPAHEAHRDGDVRPRHHGDASRDRVGRHDEAHVPDNPSTAPPYREGASRADELLAFLGGARHQEAALRPARPAEQQRGGPLNERGGPPVQDSGDTAGASLAMPMAVMHHAAGVAATPVATEADRPAAPGDMAADGGDRNAVVLHRRHHDGGASDDGGGGHDEDQAPGEPDAAAAMVIAQHIGGAPRANELLAFLNGAQAREASAPSRAAEVADLANTLTDRILVGQREDGAEQIRVTLRGDLWGRTEVTITQGADGLELRVAPASDAAADLLRERGAELAQTLSKRLDSPVVVEVTATGGGADGGDRHGRSRGYDAIVSYVAGRR